MNGRAEYSQPGSHMGRLALSMIAETAACPRVQDGETQRVGVHGWIASQRASSCENFGMRCGARFTRPAVDAMARANFSLPIFAGVPYSLAA